MGAVELSGLRALPRREASVCLSPSPVLGQRVFRLFPSPLVWCPQYPLVQPQDHGEGTSLGGWGCLDARPRAEQPLFPVLNLGSSTSSLASSCLPVPCCSFAFKGCLALLIEACQRMGGSVCHQGRVRVDKGCFHRSLWMSKRL